MGNKCYSSSKNGSSLAQTKFYIIPKHVSPFKKSKQDGFTLETETQPAVPLKFLIVIDKVKCKNLSQTDIYVNFNFADQKSIATTCIVADKNPRWKNIESFDFMTDTIKIKHSYLFCQVKSKSEKILSTVKICLYDIATGPIYHDFSLENKHSSIKGRLAFNLKMRQRVKIKIEPVKLYCELIDLLKEPSYNFSFRFMSADGQDILHTDHSEIFINNFSILAPLEKERSQSLMEEDNESYHKEDFAMEMNEPEKKLRHISDSKQDFHLKESKTSVLRKLKSIDSMQKKPSTLNLRKLEKEKDVSQTNKHEIFWDFSVEGWSIRPSVEVEIKSNDFSQSCIQFFLWSPNDIDNPNDIGKDIMKMKRPSDLKELMEESAAGENSVDLHVIKNKLIGECYININKLFKDDIRAFDDDKNMDFVISNKVKEINEKLWNHGVLIGHVKASLTVSNDPFVKQIMLGVRTEQGLKISSSVYYRDDKEDQKSTKQKEILDMIAAKDILIESMIRLYDRNKQPALATAPEKSNEEIIKQIEKIISILRISRKESLHTFLYNSKVELIKTQLMMIDLAEHLLCYADEGNEKIKGSYYKALKLILNRGELDIAQMGFDESYSFLLDPASQAKKRQFDKTVLLKMDVGLRYQQFLYDVLDKVLLKLNLKGGDKDERDFIDNFCAIAYFKIPEFRSKLQECVKKTNDTEITEWRGTEWKLDEHITEEQRDPHLVSLFNWEKSFYRFLRTDPREEKNSKKLQEVLEKNDWQKRIKKRGVAFFNFLAEWAHYIRKKVVLQEENFPWQDIQGYRVLLKALFCELKTQPIFGYSDALIFASKKMLLNEKLLNTYVAILYKKTKVYDSLNVAFTFDLINEWMNYLAREKKNIPNSFDYDFFFEGIRRVFDLDHALSIGKALSLLYRNFNIFHTDFQKEVCDYIFSRVFFRFFMHWSWNVRMVFHHLLLYRIYHLHRNMKTTVTKLDDLKVELMAYNHKRKQNKIGPLAKQHLINDLINMKYSKMMTIIENAKVKLEKAEEIKTTTDYFLTGNPEKTNSIAHLRQKLHEIKQKKIKQQSSSKTQDLSNNKADIFSKKPLNIYKDNPSLRESSFLLINSSSFEIDSKAIGDRSLSMYLRDNDDSKEGESMIGSQLAANRMHSFKGLTPSEKELIGPIEKSREKLYDDDEEEEKQREKEKEKKFPLLRRSTNNDIVKKSKSEKIVVNKRFMYYDDEGDNYIQIPEEGIKYLKTAHDEYEALKKKYVKWYNKKRQENYTMNKDDFAKLMKEILVPEVVIRQILDENELEVPKDNEW